MLQAVQPGSLSISMAVPAWYSGLVRPMDVFTLPFLVSSEARLRAALDGTLGKEMGRHADGRLQDDRLPAARGRRSVNNLRPVRTPADSRA